MRSIIVILQVVILSGSCMYGKATNQADNLLDSIIFYSETDPVISQKYAADLLTLPPESSSIFHVASAKYHKGIFFRKQQQYDSAFSYLSGALDIYSSNTPNKLSFDLYNNMGIVYKNLNLLDDALENYKNAERFFDAANQEESDHAKVYNNIGILYKKKSLYDSSLFYFFKALDIYDRDNPESSRQGSTYLNIANVYELMKNPKKSNEYLLKAEQVFRKLNLPHRLSSVFNTRGNVYYASEDYKNALRYYLEAYRIQDSINHVFIGLYSNIGMIYNDLGKYDSSTYYLEKSLKKSILNNDIEGEVVSLANLGFNFMEQNNPEKALEWHLKALNKAKKNQLLSLQRDILLGISEAYSTLQIPDSALAYYILYDNLKDSILNSETNNMIVMMEAIHQTQQSKRKIDELRIANLENQRYVFILAGAFLLLLAGMSLLLGIGKYRNKIKTDRIVKSSLIEGAEKERDSISRELHDHVGATLSMAGMMISQSLSDQKKKTTDADKDNSEKYVYVNKAGELVRTALQSIRKLSHDLSTGIVKKFGLKAAIEELLGNLKQVGISTTIKFPDNERDLSSIPDNLNITIYRVIQELITNIIKHAQARSVDFEMKLEKSVLRIVINDDGIGLNPDSIRGIGLDNIRARIEPYEGKLSFDSLNGEGTSATVVLKLKSPDKL